MSKEWQPSPDEQRIVDQAEQIGVDSTQRNYQKWIDKLMALSGQPNVSRRKLHKIIRKANRELSFVYESDFEFSQVELGYYMTDDGQWQVTMGGVDLE